MKCHWCRGVVVSDLDNLQHGITYCRACLLEVSILCNIGLTIIRNIAGQKCKELHDFVSPVASMLIYHR